MYTGTLISDLLALVERAERSARTVVATEETEFRSGEPCWKEDVTNQAAVNDAAVNDAAVNQAAMNHAALDLTDRTVPEGAWSERG